MSRIREEGGGRLLPESPLCRDTITAGRCRNIRDSEETRTGTDGHCDPGPCRPGCPMTGAGVNPPPFCRACWRHRPHRETRPTGRRRSLLPAGQDRHDAWAHRAPGPSGTTPYRRIGASRSHRAGGQRIKKDDRLPRGRSSRPKREDVLMVRGYGEGGGCSREPRQDQGGLPCRLCCPPKAGRGDLRM